MQLNLQRTAHDLDPLHDGPSATSPQVAGNGDVPRVASHELTWPRPSDVTTNTGPLDVARRERRTPPTTERNDDVRRTKEET